MKIGVRTPNPMRSIKARTTGRIKRAAKKTYNPLYGKKGMGLINNPQKSVYNKVYNKASFSLVDMITPSKKDNLFVLIFKLIIYLYYLIFYFLLYIPIKWLISKFKK